MGVAYAITFALKTKKKLEEKSKISNISQIFPTKFSGRKLPSELNMNRYNIH